MENNNIPPDFNSLEEESFDIKRWISLLVSNWYWFVLSMLIAVPVAYAFNRYSTKIYTVTSTLMVKDQGTGVSVSSLIPGATTFSNQFNMNNEMAVFRSFSLNYRVMNELPEFLVVYRGVGKRRVVESDLYTSCPFKVVFDNLDNQPKGVKVDIEVLSDTRYHLLIEGDKDFEKDLDFGEQFTEMGFDFKIEPRVPGSSVYLKKSSNNYYFYLTDPGSLAVQYLGKLVISPVTQSLIVNLSVSGLVLQQETDYLNKLMDVYVGMGLDKKNQMADSTMNFINHQLAILSDSLKKAEDNLENFRLTNKFLDLSSEGTRIMDKIKEQDNTRASYEMQMKYFNYLSAYINEKNPSGPLFSPSVMGITDAGLISLVSEMAGLRKESEKMGFRLGGSQPAMEFLEKQMEDTKNSLQENIRNNVAILNDLISDSDKKVSAIEETDLEKLTSLERQFMSIQRKVNLNNTLYTFLLQKYSETAISKASNIPDSRIIDRASDYSATQIKPKTKKNLMVAIMLGLLFPMALIVIVSLFDDKVIDKKDVEKKTKIPVIGFISHSESDSHIPVAQKPGSALAESFRSVRTSLKWYAKENEPFIIAVTSTISSEGKTFFSVNLAAIIGMLGKKVLLIGLDLRKPRMDKIFDLGDEFGMSTYLNGSNSYEEIIHKTDVNNLYYVPSGPHPPNPAELIETARMKEFLARAKKEYEFIIIDTPPVGLVTDALLISKEVDINIFIVRQRYTTKDSLDMMEQLRQQGELKNMAIVMNDISLSGYYGFGMRYNYYHGYGYYYGHSYYGSRYYGGYGYSYGYAKKRKKDVKGYYTED
jgi:tyrosine-protein kinase Etk/Wzc